MRKLLLLAILGLCFVSCSEDDDAPNNCKQPGSIIIEQLNSTSILFSWGIDAETAWEIEYGPVGFALGTGTVRQASLEIFFIEGVVDSLDEAFKFLTTGHIPPVFCKKLHARTALNLMQLADVRCHYCQNTKN
mgnify:CR=1 FL=1